MSAKSPKLPSEFEKQVREACKHYNKPERIGKLPIAGLALQAILLEDPTHATDLVGRGKALQSVIKRNLVKLEPQERHSREWEIYLCLSCYVHQYDFIKNIKINNFHVYFRITYQIPKATFNYRLKKEGIPQLSYLISTFLLEKIVWIEPIPQIVNFIGRENELTYYRQQLEQNKMAVIEGVGGIGKTALAAQLAISIKNEVQRAVCWVTLRAGLNDSPMDILYAWAVFFAQHDYPQLWAFMRATATEKKRLPEYYPILRDGLAKVKPLLCIDNLEILPKSEEAFWELLSMVQQEADVSLLLTSQTRPSLSNLDDYKLLRGLSLDKVREFLTQHQVELTDSELKEVIDYTLGNLRLLDLWAAYVRQQAVDVPTSLEKLRDSTAVDTFLASEVIDALTIQQQQAARLLALSRLPLDSFVLQQVPKNLSPLTDFDIEPDDFMHLQQLGLIQEQSGNLWSVSPLLKNQLIDKSIVGDSILIEEVIELHQWLASLYLSQGNVVEAAYHAVQGEEPQKAILWFANQQNELIEEGQASAIYKILNPIESKRLDTPIRQILHQVRGDLLQLFGDYENAELEADANLKIGSTAEAQALAKQTLGELEKRRGNTSKSADYYREALRLLEIKYINLENWLHRDLAWILTEQNDFEKAWIEAQRSQIALNNTLGHIAQRRGDWTSALDYYQNALQIGEEYGEDRLLMQVRNNVAIHYIEKNNIEEALILYQESLKSVEEIGDLRGKGITLINLSICYKQLGQLDLAIKNTMQALFTFKKLDYMKGQMFASQNLAELYLLIGDLDQAQMYGETITEIKGELKTTREYAEGLRIYAEILLAQKELSSALERGQQGLNILREPNTVDKFTDPFYAKLACETLAHIHGALGNTAEAEKYNVLANELEKKLKQ